MILQIDQIVYDKKLYPREKVNESKVAEYSEILTLLPPITVNQNYVIIDGAHRYFAHKRADQKEINVVIIETKDDDDLFLKAIEMNARHGYQLTNTEKKKQVVVLYEKVLAGTAKSYDVARLKESFSIPDATFSDWTRDLNDKLAAQQLQKILALHLQCMTQEEIAKIIGLKRNTVADKISEMQAFLRDLSENPDSEIPTKLAFLAENHKEKSAFAPLLYNVWNQQAYDSENQHFGKFPMTFMENLLYYYTQPFDVVFDPFAGGGTTIDACKKWLRKYYCSDLNPIETRQEEIVKWDIGKGLPENLPANIDFVFLDPPYWKQAENQYSEDKEDFANMSKDDFYASMGKLFDALTKKIKPGSHLAFVISSSQWKNEGRQLEDHTVKLMAMLDSKKWIEHQRFILPYSTQQYNAQQVECAKKEKICLNSYRDLVVFEKKG